MNGPPARALQFEMKDVENDVGPPVQQNDVCTDDDMCAIRRRRGQLSCQFRRAGLNFLLQTRRERATTNELPFETGRQLISLGEPGRQIGAMFCIPVAHFFPVAIAIVGVSVIAIVIMGASVAFTMPIAAALREGEASGHGKHSDHAGTERSPR